LFSLSIEVVKQQNCRNKTNEQVQIAVKTLSNADMPSDYSVLETFSGLTNTAYSGMDAICPYFVRVAPLFHFTGKLPL
jgi:hypothetical protein